MEQRSSPDKPIRPIAPDEVTRHKVEEFPPEVIETSNRFIVEKVLNGEALVFQGDVVDDLVLKGLQRAQIFKRGWLNVEDMYREAGWHVEYDKPGYNESYPASFKFKAPKE